MVVAYILSSLISSWNLRNSEVWRSESLQCYTPPHVELYHHLRTVFLKKKRKQNAKNSRFLNSVFTDLAARDNFKNTSHLCVF